MGIGKEGERDKTREAVESVWGGRGTAHDVGLWVFSITNQTNPRDPLGPVPSNGPFGLSQ